MRVRKMNSDGVKIHDSVQVKLKTAGTTQVIQFTAGNNKSLTGEGSLFIDVDYDARIMAPGSKNGEAFSLAAGYDILGV